MAMLAASVAVVFLVATKPNDVEWLSAPPGNGPPRFGFLGKKWGWKANGLWERSMGAPKTVALTAAVTEFDSLDSLTNLPRALLQATNLSGDRLWVFNKQEKLAEKVRSWTGVETIDMPGMTWNENNQAQLSTHDVLPLGFTNQTVRVGWWIDARVSRAAANSLRLTFFATANEKDKTRMRWISNTVTEIGLRTNTWFGARVTVPEGGSVFLLSGRTNGEGKSFGAVLSPSLP
jgi:hypothetical protein